ncbi:hypothetical protein [Anaerosporobacter faecicola]|uniref:hypothetical protein n=1 Tax=Anaerosporobacter faecicola TaxID=2718714 RepID=UPI00143B5475|nr:hypothetical protein [Anaerosporobacter faecicola]
MIPILIVCFVLLIPEFILCYIRQYRIAFLLPTVLLIITIITPIRFIIGIIVFLCSVLMVLAFNKIRSNER